MKTQPLLSASVLVCLIVGCSSQRNRATGHALDPIVTVENPKVAARRTRVEPWVSATEAELGRRTRNASGFLVDHVSCSPLHCQLNVLDTLQEGHPSDQLTRWLRENWTFHWKVEEVSPRDSKSQFVSLTLYRHPADRGTPNGHGYSSLSGSSATACERGADCSHPNWNEPYICERTFTECPAIEINGKLLCFENKRIACDCAKHSKLDMSSGVLINCNAVDYPY